MAIPAEEKIGLTGFLKIQEQLTSQENTTYILNTPWQNEKWKREKCTRKHASWIQPRNFGEESWEMQNLMLIVLALCTCYSLAEDWWSGLIRFWLVWWREAGIQKAWDKFDPECFFVEEKGGGRKDEGEGKELPFLLLGQFFSHFVRFFFPFGGSDFIFLQEQ